MPETPSLSELRLLILSPKASTASVPSVFPPVLQFLTGESPSKDLTSFAGYTSHPPLVLKTKYYSKQVSLWCDELPPASIEISDDGKKPVTSSEKNASEDGDEDGELDEALTLQQWQDTMLSSAASEVRAVMGGIVLILPVSPSHSPSEAQLDSWLPYLRAAHALREAIEDDSFGRDIASVIILQDTSSAPAGSDAKAGDTLLRFTEALETRTIDNDMFGWDVAYSTSQVTQSGTSAADSEKRNEFGEKLGMARVIEVLEGIDWAVTTGGNDDEDDEDTSDILGNDRFKGLDHELQQEMLGLKLSMLDDDQMGEPSEGEDISAEQMDELKSRVLAIRDTVAGMPQEQKEAFAKREIDRIMRDL